MQHGRRVHELIETKQPWADVLVVTAIDRLTREAEDGISLIKRLMPNGGRHKPVLLVSLDDHIDLAGATGRMIAKFRIVLAEYERELIGERIANALRHRRRAGLPYAGTSYGWHPARATTRSAGPSTAAAAWSRTPRSSASSPI